MARSASHAQIEKRTGCRKLALRRQSLLQEGSMHGTPIEPASRSIQMETSGNSAKSWSEVPFVVSGRSAHAAVSWGGFAENCGLAESLMPQ